MAKTPPTDAENSALSPSARIAALDDRIVELNERLDRAPMPPSVDAVVVEEQNNRILELQRLVSNLGERVAAVQAVHSRDAQFNAVVQSVDAAAAAVQRSMAVPTGPTGVPIDSGYREPPGVKSDCDCHDGPCGCVSCGCCTFEVWMTHVRVDHMQLPIEPDDSNILPMSEMEIWMFASIDPLYNIGVCIPDPGPASYLPLHKQVTDPYGPWVSVNRCIGTVSVKKGVPLVVPITLTGVEREPDRLIPLNRDEWGSGTENLTLDCCYSNYSPVLIPVPLTSWGQGGGGITGKFMVVRKC